MSFFHLRTLPSYAWPALPDAALAQVWTAYVELDKSQWLTPAEIERGQLEQVRSLLAHCVVNIPYYRRVLSEAGIAPGTIKTMDDFRRIPILKRATYQQELADLTAVRLPPGTSATDQATTSGTTGKPVTVLKTNMVGLWWCACYLRDLEWCGLDPTGVAASIRALGATPQERKRALEGISSPSWSPHLKELIETGPAFAMDIHQDPRRQYQWLRQVAPDYLTTYPSNLEVLAGLVREQGRIQSLKIIQAIGETLTPEVQGDIESAFGVPVKNVYSGSEAGYLASPCPRGHGLHVHAENVLLEVVDEEDRPCHPGQTGRVLFTTLHNLRAPFVRFEVGDAVTLGAGPCPCGRGLPLLDGVQGKYWPMFRLPDGRHKCAQAVCSILRGLGSVRQNQVIQKAIDHVVVRLVVDAAWTEDHAARLRREMQEFFETPIRVDLQISDRLELPAGGKLQALICEVG